MRNLFRALCSLLLLTTTLSACGGGGTPLPVATGVFYVLERVNKAVYIYDNVATMDGALDPVRTLSGENTQLENPSALAVDTRRNILYVSETDGQQILAFFPASTVEGATAPKRTYPGLIRSTGLYYDLKNDVLYAADAVDQSILAWDGISTMDTGTGPTRRIGLGYLPSAVFVDTQRNILYVGDPGSATVQTYSSALTLGINLATPSTSIQDETQPFVNINSITMNVPNNFLFVAEDFNPSVEVFTSASTATGSTDTARSLEGDLTTLTLDMNQAIFLDNVLYVQVNRTQIGIWNEANSLNGNIAPNRLLTVNPAQQILGFAIDLAH